MDLADYVDIETLSQFLLGPLRVRGTPNCIDGSVPAELSPSERFRDTYR